MKSTLILLAVSAFAAGNADMPPAVKAAADKELKPGATITRVQKQVDDGVTEYEVRYEREGHIRKVAFSPAGEILEVEEETTLDQIPAPAKEAIVRAAAGGEIRKIDKVTRKGVTVYEGEMTVAGKRKSPRFDAAGKPVR